MKDHVFIIPVYGESPYLEKCILSLLAQTVKSTVIMTTSSPSVFTRNLASAYGLSYRVNDRSQTGIAADWNFALAESEAGLVTIAHQDDIYEPEYAESVIRRVKNAGLQNVLLVFTGYSDLVGTSNRRYSLNAVIKKSLLWPFILKNTISHSFFKKLILLFGDPICCPTVTLNMSKLSDFRFSDAFNCALDWHAWYGLAGLPGAFIFINQKLVKHRIHQESETVNQLNTGGRKAEELRIFEMIWGRLPALFLASIYTLGHKENQEH